MHALRAPLPPGPRPQPLQLRCATFDRLRPGRIARTLDRTQIAARDPDLWRYRELLPVRDPAPRITLGEGMTPLLPLRFLGPSLGLETVLLKDEALKPTGSFKARGIATAVTMAGALVARRIALPSAGNAGSAAAAYGALAGLAVDHPRFKAMIEGAEKRLAAGG